jgi:hypothetical protein
MDDRREKDQSTDEIERLGFDSMPKFVDQAPGISLS